MPKPAKSRAARPKATSKPARPDVNQRAKGMMDQIAARSERKAARPDNGSSAGSAHP